MPSPATANINATVLAIEERAADLVSVRMGRAAWNRIWRSAHSAVQADWG
jgi:hypothetical protein